MNIDRELVAEVSTLGQLETLIDYAKLDMGFDTSAEVDLSDCTIRIFATTERK